MTDHDLDAELVAHAQGRPLIERVFPADQCDFDHADALLAPALRRFEEAPR